MVNVGLLYIHSCREISQMLINFGMTSPFEHANFWRGPPFVAQFLGMPPPPKLHRPSPYP